MALSSLSTFDDWFAEYIDTADYDVSGSIAKARRHVVACRTLLVMMPRRQRHGGTEEIEVDPAVLERSRDAALAFVKANSGGSTLLDFRNLR